MNAPDNSNPQAATFDPGRRTFNDADGRTWRVRVSVDTKRRLKADAVALDLSELVDGKKLIALCERLSTDVEFLVDVLFVVVEDQARDYGLGPREFAAAMLGDPIFEAARVLVAAILDFFPQARARDAARAIVEKAWQVATKTQRLGAAKMQAALDAVDVDRAAATLIGSSNVAREFSASSPAPSRSAISSRSHKRGKKR